MFAFAQSYPLLLGITLIVLDLTLWQLIPVNRRPWRIAARLLVFSLFTWVLISAGVSRYNLRPGSRMCRVICSLRCWGLPGGCLRRVPRRW